MNGFNDLRPEIAYLPSKDEDGNPAALRYDLTSIGYVRTPDVDPPLPIRDRRQARGR